MVAIAVKDLIPHILEKQVDWRITLARDWNGLVGSLAARTRLEKIYDDTVVIGVYESHWMQELFLLSADIKELLNRALQVPRIKHVRFKLVETRKKKCRIIVRKSFERPCHVLLTDLQTNALTRISDEELRHALTDFWARCSVFQEKK